MTLKPFFATSLGVYYVWLSLRWRGARKRCVHAPSFSKKKVDFLGRFAFQRDIRRRRMYIYIFVYSYIYIYVRSVHTGVGFKRPVCCRRKMERVVLMALPRFRASLFGYIYMVDIILSYSEEGNEGKNVYITLLLAAMM